MYDLNRKIIFIHPPKTGGTTIEGAFKWHPNFHDHLPNCEEYLSFFKKYKHESLSNHIEALNAQNLDYKNFFKFACIRNPWDIMVSRYHHDIKLLVDTGEVQSNNLPEYLKHFDKYISTRAEIIKQDWVNVEKYFLYQGDYCIDYVIRYENYKKDAEKIFSKYNVTWPETSYNTKSRPKNAHYKDFFTNTDTKNLVEEAAKDYIKMFNYKF